MSVLIDSDILIEVSRGKDPAILARWVELSESNEPIFCSPVSVAELWHGARPRECGALMALFNSLVCVPIDAEAGLRAGKYLNSYHKSHGLELGDALIASAAVSQDAALWTQNRKHYPMKGLLFY